MGIPKKVVESPGKELADASLPVKKLHEDSSIVEIIVGEAGNIKKWTLDRLVLLVVCPGWEAKIKNGRIFINLEPAVFAYIADWILGGGGKTPIELHGKRCYPCTHQVNFCKIFQYAEDEGISELAAWAMHQMFSSMGELRREYLDPAALNWIWSESRMDEWKDEPIIHSRTNTPPVQDATKHEIVESSSDDDSDDDRDWDAPENKTVTKKWAARMNFKKLDRKRKRYTKNDPRKKMMTRWISKPPTLLEQETEEESGNQLLTSEVTEKDSGKNLIRIKVPSKRVQKSDLSRGPPSFLIEIEFLKLAMRILKSRKKKSGCAVLDPSWIKNAIFMERLTLDMKLQYLPRAKGLGQELDERQNWGYWLRYRSLKAEEVMQHRWMLFAPESAASLQFEATGRDSWLSRVQSQFAVKD